MDGTTALALFAVFASGVFGLLGVVVGVVGTTGTQIFLDWKRERQTSDRAKQLVAGELLNAQLMLRAAAKGPNWPHFEDREDADARLPTSAWREHQAGLAGHIDADLWDQLVIAYALLETDRARFISEDPDPAMVARESGGLKESAKDLGQLRRKLWPSGGWLDDLDAAPPTQGS
jgi:hypothetical protein